MSVLRSLKHHRCLVGHTTVCAWSNTSGICTSHSARITDALVHSELWPWYRPLYALWYSAVTLEMLLDRLPERPGAFLPCGENERQKIIREPREACGALMVPQRCKEQNMRYDETLRQYLNNITFFVWHFLFEEQCDIFSFTTAMSKQELTHLTTAELQTGSKLNLSIKRLSLFFLDGWIK